MTFGYRIDAIDAAGPWQQAVALAGGRSELFCLDVVVQSRNAKAQEADVHYNDTKAMRLGVMIIYNRTPRSGPGPDLLGLAPTLCYLVRIRPAVIMAIGRLSPLALVKTCRRIPKARTRSPRIFLGAPGL
jgi:hypothetical protein